MLNVDILGGSTLSPLASTTAPKKAGKVSIIIGYNGYGYQIEDEDKLFLVDIFDFKSNRKNVL